MQLPDLELESLKFLDEVTTPLRGMRDPQKALRHTLKATRDFFGAAHGCIAVARAGQLPATIVLGTPKGGHWDRPSLGRFVRYRDRPWRGTLILAPVDRRGGPWGVMALARPQRPFERHDGQLLARIALVLSDALQQMDRERMLDVRDRIDRKIMEQIHPKDLFYQILDGLRSLTHYDHSSALLIREDSDGRAAAGRRADCLDEGQERADRADAAARCRRCAARSSRRSILGFDRRGDGWHEWTGKPAGRAGRAPRLQPRQASGGAAAKASHAVRAARHPRWHRSGVLKVAARHPGQPSTVRCEPRRSFPLAGGGRHPEPAPHRIAAAPAC